MGTNIESLAQGKTAKQKIQLQWEDITIRAVPPKKKCGKGNPLAQEKTIINCVSGTVRPGEFLAIIGASGKSPSLNR